MLISRDGMGADMIQMLSEDIIGQPGGQRIVRKRIAKGLRRPVRGVGIPVADMQHPVVGRSVAPDPVQNGRSHRLCRFHTALSGVVHFVEASIEPPGRMAFGKGADRHRAEAGLDAGWPAVLPAQAIREGAFGSLHTQVGRCSSMSDDAGMNVPNRPVIEAAREGRQGASEQ